MKRCTVLAAVALTLITFSALSVSPVMAEGARYQIVKSKNGTLWRLDAETGEIAVCQVERAQTLDKLVDVFERILDIAEKHQNSVGDAPRAPIPGAQ